MDAYSIGKMAGVLAGIAIGAVVVVIILAICNKNRKLKTEYDERQKIIRGNGYRFGFYAMTGWAVVNMLLSFAGIELPMEGAVIAFSYIFIGALADVLYCIFHDAYWGLNNNKRRYLISFLAIAVLNLFISFGAYRNGSLIVDGKLGATGTNLFVAVLFLLIGLAMIIQSFRDKTPAED